MTSEAYRRTVAERLTPDGIAELPQDELMEIVATLWADVELATILHGSEAFFWERMLHFTERGYLTAQEDQGIRRLLALSYRPQLVHLLEHAEGTAEAEVSRPGPAVVPDLLPPRPEYT